MLLIEVQKGGRKDHQFERRKEVEKASSNFELLTALFL